MIKTTSQRLYSFRIKKIRAQEDTIHLSWGLDRDLEVATTLINEVDELESDILSTAPLQEEDESSEENIEEEEEEEDLYEEMSGSDYDYTEDEDEEKTLVELAQEGDLTTLPMEDEEGQRYLKVFYAEPSTPDEENRLAIDIEDWVEVEFHSVREGLYELRNMPRNA